MEYEVLSAEGVVLVTGGLSGRILIGHVGRGSVGFRGGALNEEICQREDREKRKTSLFIKGKK